MCRLERGLLSLFTRRVTGRGPGLTGRAGGRPGGRAGGPRAVGWWKLRPGSGPLRSTCSTLSGNLRCGPQGK